MTQAATPANDALVDALRAQVAMRERELADAKNEKNRLLGLLEQKALAAPSKAGQAPFWDRLFGVGK